MAPSKRQDNTRATKAAKKQKLDPVTAKVKDVLDALRKDGCEVPGPHSCRDGLLAAVPHALGLGAASDERHAFQAAVSKMVGEILVATESKWQGLVKDAEKNHAAAQDEQTTLAKALEEVKAQLSTQRTEVQQQKETLVANLTAESEAKKALKTAEAEVANFDSAQAEKATHREELAAVLAEDFEALKAAEFSNAGDESKHLNKLKAMLTKIALDKSLVSAVPAAFGKKPADRGSFDETVVSQVHQALQDKLKELESELSNGDALKAQKEAEVGSATAVLNAAQEKRASSEQASKSAQEKAASLEADEKRAQESLNEQEAAVSDMDVNVFTEKVHLQTWQEALKAFEFLRDRIAEAPVQDEAMEESVEAQAKAEAEAVTASVVA